MITRAPRRDLEQLVRWLSTSAPSAPERDEAENQLYESCFELGEAARDLEIAAGAPGSAAASAAALGTLLETLDVMASAVLRLGDEFVGSLPRDADPERRREFLDALASTTGGLEAAQDGVGRARVIIETLSAGT